MENKFQRTILLACDHAGYTLKHSIMSYLKSKNLEFKDVGTFSAERCDYPDNAAALAKEMDKKKDLGILVCGTGTGISIAANKFKGIRCSICNNFYVGKKSIEIDNPNCIAMGERVVGEQMALEIVELFLSKKLAEEPSEKEIADELTELEEKNLLD